MHIPNRIAAATIVLALACLSAAVSSTASAQALISVNQGQTVLVGTFFRGESATVEPSVAGTFEFLLTQGGAEVRFTASTSYAGPATIYGIDSLSRQIVIASVRVVGPSAEVGPRADVGATFTPRPAPGPCIQIVSGGTVGFGDVTLGTPKTATTETTVRSCTSIDTTLGAAVAPATSGLAPNVVTLTPTDQTPVSAGSFRYEIDAGFPVALTGGASLFADPFTAGATRTFAHSLLVGAGSSGVGQQFSTTVTFTATAA